MLGPVCLIDVFRHRRAFGIGARITCLGLPLFGLLFHPGADARHHPLNRRGGGLGGGFV